MKKILILLLIGSPLFGFSQAVTADPALEPMKLTTLGNITIFASELPLNGVYKLKVPILNKNLANNLPAGSCKVKIGLGSKLVLSSSFNLNSVNTSNYFSWTAVSSGGQVQIIGDLINQLPANFNDTASFDVTGIIVGNSTITTNFLVTNHNTAVTLSDENGANNIASTVYTIVAGALSVKFTSIGIEKKECALKVTFDTENEINVSRYELEMSKDLNNFEKISTAEANNLKRYSFNYFTLPEIYHVPALLIRVKSIDIDGKVQYSETKKISGTCDSKTGMLLYPNPVPRNINSISLEKNNGFFNGTYIISVLDMSGKIIKTTELKLTNIAKFNYEINNISAGQYLLKMLNVNNNLVEVIKVIKY